MIVFFSGTGNTRRCALLLAELLGDSVHELSPDELRCPQDTLFDTPEERVIWAFPTYSWGMPPVVENYLKRVRFGAGVLAARHYMLTTCGDDMGHTDRQWRGVMKHRNLNAAGAYAVIMPNTYVLMKGFNVDSAEVMRDKLARSLSRIEDVARAITSDGGDMLLPGSWPAVKSKIIYRWFRRFAMSPKPFHANAGCTGCGLCAMQCPMANIEMTDGKPQWGDSCAMCLRCYHACPRRAVAYGKQTDGKGQYLCPRK